MHSVGLEKDKGDLVGVNSFALTIEIIQIQKVEVFTSGS